MDTICCANLGQNLFLANQASCQEFDLRWQVHTQKDRMPETEKKDYNIYILVWIQ